MNPVLLWFYEGSVLHLFPAGLMHMKDQNHHLSNSVLLSIHDCMQNFVQFHMILLGISMFNFTCYYLVLPCYCISCITFYVTSSPFYFVRSMFALFVIMTSFPHINVRVYIFFWDILCVLKTDWRCLALPRSVMCSSALFNDASLLLSFLPGNVNCTEEAPSK